MGKLQCPDCNADLILVQRVVRLVEYTTLDYEHLGVFSDKADWDIETECDDPDCTYADCEAQHKFDKQQNRFLLTGSSKLKLSFDADYEESSDEESVENISIVCRDGCGFEVDLEDREVEHHWA